MNGGPELIINDVSETHKVTDILMFFRLFYVFLSLFRCGYDFFLIFVVRNNTNLKTTTFIIVEANWFRLYQTSSGKNYN